MSPHHSSCEAQKSSPRALQHILKNQESCVEENTSQDLIAEETAIQASKSQGFPIWSLINPRCSSPTGRNGPSLSPSHGRKGSASMSGRFPYPSSHQLRATLVNSCYDLLVRKGRKGGMTIKQEKENGVNELRSSRRSMFSRSDSLLLFKFPLNASEKIGVKLRLPQT